MSVFNKVVSRVRDFFLEPGAEEPAPKPVASGLGTGPLGRETKPAAEGADSFEWEPPEKWRAQNDAVKEPSKPLIAWSGDGVPPPSPPATTPPAARQQPFSPRNFSTAELQKSSVLDIVAAVEARHKATAPAS